MPLDRAKAYQSGELSLVPLRMSTTILEDALLLYTGRSTCYHAHDAPNQSCLHRIYTSVSTAQKVRQVRGSSCAKLIVLDIYYNPSARGPLGMLMDHLHPRLFHGDCHPAVSVPYRLFQRQRHNRLVEICHAASYLSGTALYAQALSDDTREDKWLHAASTPEHQTSHPKAAIHCAVSACSLLVMSPDMSSQPRGVQSLKGEPRYSL